MSDKLKILPLTSDNINLVFDCNDVKNVREYLRDVDNIKRIGLDKAIIYNYDSVEFGDICDLKYDFDNIMECRLFNENSEISFKLECGVFSGSIVKDYGENKDFYKKENYYVYRNGDNNLKYSMINVKKYISFDNDGQAFFYYMKPCTFIKGGIENV